jgi:uncharacterized membrane protein
MGTSRSRVFSAVAVIGLLVAFSLYAGVTYPRTALSVPISFTIGVDVITRAFNVPLLNEAVQVQVAVESGALLWNVQILNTSHVVWEHSASQGEQTRYASDWIKLPSGTYNFTFRTVGIGSLNAQITVTSKGGFW